MPSQLNSSESIVAPQDIVESALRHKLEQAIEKMIFSSPGEIDSNLEFYLNLAREHGFTDLARDIEQYTAETLIEFLKEKKKKRTRSAREEHLEDFLMKGNNLELVEPGLTALDRQVTLPSGGILDILARDVSGNETVVELKAEEYRSPSVFEQLRGYLAETGNRTLLVAPKVNPDLFYSLIDQYDQGSLDFHLANPVTEGEEYKITPFNPESIPKEKRKPIDWAKANRKRKSNGKVRLFGSGREGKVVIKNNDQNIPPSSKSENTPKMTPSELRDLPLRYQIMELYGINRDKPQRLSEQTFVTESQKRKLEELLNSERLDKEIELGEKRKSLFDKLREIEFLDGNGHINMIDFGEGNVNINLLKKTQRKQSGLAEWWQRSNSEASMYASFSENTNPLEYFKGVEEFRKTEEHYRANGQIHSLTTNSEPKSLKERFKEVKRIYEEVESKLDKFEKSFDFGKTCAVLKNELPRFDDISMILRSPYIRSDIELQKIKLGMVDKLTSIDETLARIVFDYTPLTHSYLSKLNSFESEVKTFNEETNSYSHISMLHHFTEGFQSLCTEIMGSLKVVPTYAALIQQRNLAPETETKYLSAIEVTREQKQSLEALVRNKLLSDLQERAQFKRVSGEIVGEIASNGIDLPANEKALWHKSDLILEKKKKELKPLLEPIENYMNQDFSTFSIDRLEQIIQNAEREVNRVAGANKEHVQRYNEGMRVMARSKLSGSRAGDDLAKGLKVFNGIRSTLTGLKTEANRIRGLMEVDRTLGLAYMCYTFNTHFDMEGGYEEDNESNRENGLRYHQGDQRFYEEILENMIVEGAPSGSSLLNLAKPEPKKPEKNSNPKPQKDPELLPSKKQKLPAPRYDAAHDITNAIGISNSDDPRYDQYKGSCEALVDDVTGASYDTKQVKAFARSLRDLGFRNRLVNGGEGPDPIMLSTFVSDINDQYVSKGLVPEGRDLVKLYDQVNKELGEK